MQALDFNKLFDVHERIVIVTGSNRGNGYAIAKGLVANGARVVRIDLSFDSSLASEDRVLDLADISGIASVIQEIAERHGRIDCLINNAGVSMASNTPYSDPAAYNMTLAINLHAAFALCSAVCPIMAKQSRGSIVNITSLGSVLGFPNNPAYQVAKAGLRQLTKAIARDWGQSGVRANNLCPGYIRTAMTEKSFNDPMLNEQRRSRTLLGRWGESWDLVGPALFLASDASAYVTGADLYVDGGWTAHGGI